MSLGDPHDRPKPRPRSRNLARAACRHRDARGILRDARAKRRCTGSRSSEISTHVHIARVGRFFPRLASTPTRRTGHRYVSSLTDGATRAPNISIARSILS